jgi:hypothetical protein
MESLLTIVVVRGVCTIHHKGYDYSSYVIENEKHGLVRCIRGIPRTGDYARAEKALNLK